MRVLVLGAAGFIGTRLVRTLQQQGLPGRDGEPARQVDELVLADARPVSSARMPGFAGEIETHQGDICSPVFQDALFKAGFDVVFHLAAALTLDAEVDFARGMEVNLHGLMQLLERCRAQSRPPALVFASSISTFGGPLPDVVDDEVVQRPQTSYGTHKAIAELLISDYSRRGFLDGRVLRLPIVLTHPGPSTASVSDRIAAIIREPLNGRDVVCPVAADTRFPVASVGRVARALIAMLAVPEDALGVSRVCNLPSLTVTPTEMVQAVERHAGARPPGVVRWEQDDAMQAIVDGWPRAFTSARALALGISADESIDAVVAAYLEDSRDDV
jgi:nucleoside-diphosphate-sugar epimerase